MELNVLVLVSMDDPQRQTKRMVKNTVEESVNLVKYANTVGAQDVHLSDPEPHSPRPPMITTTTRFTAYVNGGTRSAIRIEPVEFIFIYEGVELKLDPPLDRNNFYQ